MFHWIIIFQMHQNITCIFLRLQRKQLIKYVHFVSDFRWSREASDFCACSDWSIKMATTTSNTISNITEIKQHFLAMVPTRNLKLMVRASNDKHKETLWIFYLVVHNVLFIIINVFLEKKLDSQRESAMSAKFCTFMPWYLVSISRWYEPGVWGLIPRPNLYFGNFSPRGMSSAHLTAETAGNVKWIGPTEIWSADSA